MIAELPSQSRCIVKVRDNSSGRSSGPPPVAPKPRHILVNGSMLPSPGIHQHQQHQNHHQNQSHPPSPPSPPLPPPPPPPPLDSTIPRNFLRPIPIKREDKLFSNQTSSLAKRVGNHFTADTCESVATSMPAAQVRRSLSMAKEHELKVLETGKRTADVKHNVAKQNQSVQNCSLQMSNDQFMSRKPGNLFLSQLYFLFHLSLVVCILRANDATKKVPKSRFHESVIYFLGYLLGTSIIFLCSIRFCKSDLGFNRKSSAKNSAVLFGSMSLGLVQLISIGLDFAQCAHKYFIFLPILQFCFNFVLMHFILTQARTGQQMGFSNLTIAHLIVTQMALWLASFDSNYGPCGYSTTFPASSLTSNGTEIEMYPIYPFAGLLVPVIHHFQLLTIFILVLVWFANNDLKSVLNQPSITSEAQNMAYHHFLKRKASIKGFFIGLLMIAASIVVLVLQNTYLSLVTHTTLQGFSALASLCGIILGRDKLKAIYSEAGNFARDHRIIIFITIAATYYCATCMIIGNLISRTINFMAIADGICMIFHSSFQTVLIRSGQQSGSGKMREIFALLILANFSIWFLEVSQVASKLMVLQTMDILLLPPILMSLNRFYSALVFIDFWRGK